MAETRVGTLKARYRLPPSLSGEGARLDRLLREAVDEPLDMAIELARERLGIRPDELVCIRRLRVPVRLRLSAADRELVTLWSLRLADAIEARMADADPRSFVRYGSRVSALADLALGLARGSRERAWAWHRLGLIAAQGPVTSDELARGLVRALGEDPPAIVTVLRRVADAGLLPALVERLPADCWARLAERALAAVDLPSLTAFEWDRLTTGHPLAGGSDGVLARAFTGCAPGRKARRFPTLACAALAALDAEPGIAANPRRAARRILEMHTLIGGGTKSGGHSGTHLGEARSRLATRAAHRGAPSEPVAPPERGSTPEHRPDRLPEVHSSESEPWRHSTADIEAESQRPGSKPQAAPDPRSEGRPDPARGVCAETREAAEKPPVSADPGVRHPVRASAGDPVPLAADSLTEPYSNVPARAPAPWHTGCGGLLFLIPMLAELGLPERMVASATLAERPLALGLHRLGRMLAHCGDQDPALAAFCGRVPGTEPPWNTEASADPDLQNEVTGWASEVRAALGRRLDPDAVDLDGLLAGLVRRDALVIAEPGWIELVLALDGVSVPVRRAGLDLDPGWVPWLGVVIRYVYE